MEKVLRRKIILKSFTPYCPGILDLQDKNLKIPYLCWPFILK